MKKILLAIAMIGSVTACDDKLDIVPKGQSTLESVTDLEMLFNQNYDLGMPYSDLGIICNETLGMGDNVLVQLTQKSTNEYAWLAYDETVDRAGLTLSDSRYENAYKYINYMNTVIDKMPDATGDDSKKPALMAEAHVMRAYLHWLLVNIYAKQYDAATAATDGGIAYVTDLDVTSTKEKETVAEVYEKILADCSDEYINALPEHSSDVLRGDQAWGNAVRAKVLMQMKRYADALPYAEKAISINGNLQDRSSIVESGDWELTKQDASNYVYFGTMVAPFMEVLSLETAGMFETGDYVNDYAFFGGKSDDGGDDWDDDDDWGDDEEWDDETYYGGDGVEAYTAKRHISKAKALKAIRAFKAKSSSTRALDDENEGLYDDGDDADEDEYTPANVSSPAWSILYGYMFSGVMGAPMFFGMSAYVNTYGITADRMYYTAAECAIRSGQIQKGLDYVNAVRKLRIDAAHYSPLTASTEEEAMALMQPCKWIECICTYESFFDCKRWNTEDAYRRTITRTVYDSDFNPMSFSISPDSPLWIFPFPANVTRLNPSMTQNY